MNALRARPSRVESLVSGIRKLNLASDQDAFKACYEAGNLDGIYINDILWRGELINTFPNRSEIRDLAIREIGIRGGNLDAVSHRFGDNEEMRKLILARLCPLRDADRLSLIYRLEASASSNDLALERLEAARQDTEGQVGGEAIIGWTEAFIAKNQFKKKEEAFLVSQLDAIGPDYDHRRAAATVSLGIADRVARVADWCKKDQHHRLHLNMISVRSKDDRYVRRLLPLWDSFSLALGGDAAVLECFGISAESCLGLFNPEVTNSARIFRLLHEAVPTSRHVRPEAHLAALARFEPDGEAMRDLVMPIVSSSASFRGQRQINANLWGILKAAEIFGEYFSDRDVLLQQVIDAFETNPSGPGATAALAEMLLRRPNQAVEGILAHRAKGTDYDIATGFKVLAAVGSISEIIIRLRWVLNQNLSEYGGWNFSYWVPSLIRRLEKDSDLALELLTESIRANSTTAKLSFLALAGKSTNGRSPLRASVLRVVEAIEKENVPSIGFDITSVSLRLAKHLAREFAP